MRYLTTMLAAAALISLPVDAGAQTLDDVAEGAQIWANTCVRCHNARPTAERTDAQWVVIVNHMRARANLTKTNARFVTAFLQAMNTPEGQPTAPADPFVQARDEVQENGTTEDLRGGLALVAALDRYLRILGTQ